MTRDKTLPSPKIPTRERVLDAAERLLAQGSAGFSMRDLADEAAVSFATPFNQFGSKSAIMLALSERRIAAMQAQLSSVALPATAFARVQLAIDIATSVMLAAPGVNRAVMAAIGTPSDEPGTVAARSSALWAAALGGGEGFTAATRSLALAVLPDQLALTFRGVLSFWTAGEIPDASLNQRARVAAAVALLAFVERGGRGEILHFIESSTHGMRPPVR